MRVPTFFGFIVTALPFAFADVKFTEPGAGATIQADVLFTVTWEEGGNLPRLSDASAYTLALYSGSNSHPVCAP